MRGESDAVTVVIFTGGFGSTSRGADVFSKPSADGVTPEPLPHCQLSPDAKPCVSAHVGTVLIGSGAACAWRNSYMIHVQMVEEKSCFELESLIN